MLRSMLHFPLPNDLPILNRLPFLVTEKETLSVNLFLWSVSDDENEKFSFMFIWGMLRREFFIFVFYLFLCWPGKLRVMTTIVLCFFYFLKDATEKGD